MDGMDKAVVLLSGGMDSAVTLYMARRSSRCSALIFDYGQKARKEIECAVGLAETPGIPYHLMKIDLPWKGSSLLEPSEDVPGSADNRTGVIPSTYVPARNMIFLSYGVSFAEAIGAGSVFIGAHQLDYSNYPDCRGEFFGSFREMVSRGTRSGVEGRSVRIETPILDMTKKQIVQKGIELGVPFEHTWSCYKQGDRPCGECESCAFRIKAFEECGMTDPLM